jgi:hypothetical protein
MESLHRSSEPIRFSLNWAEATRRLNANHFTDSQANKYMIWFGVFLFLSGGAAFFELLSMFLCYKADDGPKRNVMNFVIRFCYTSTIVYVRYFIFLLGMIFLVVLATVLSSATDLSEDAIFGGMCVSVVIVLIYYFVLLVQQHRVHKRVSASAPATYTEPGAPPPSGPANGQPFDAEPIERYQPGSRPKPIGPR